MNQRDEFRKVFFNAWRKYKQQLPVEPLEAQLIEIISLHPEYHTLLEQPENTPIEEESNPFLHMSLHLALREQIATNRPVGIKTLYHALGERFGDNHMAEHQMMEQLADTLWQAQQSGVMPDEKMYLEKLMRL